MNEITKLAIETIKELMKLSVPEINEVREVWRKTAHEADGVIHHKLLDSFVDYTCDFAIRKLSAKTA